MNNKTQNMGVPIGTSLLLVVFVLLALITFATLSYVSANTDNKLSQNVADTTTSYYKAEEAAQKTLMQIHEAIMAVSDSDIEEMHLELQAGLDGYNVEMRNDSIFVSFETVVSDQESIFSEVEVLSDGEYEITRWQLLYTEEWESSTEFPVFI